MGGALETLLFGDRPEGRSLFLNGQWHPDIGFADFYQSFKPYAEIIEEAGGCVLDDIPAGGAYNNVWVLLPKNAIEAQYLIACGCGLLRQGGNLYCAGENKAGGGRIQKWMQQFGFQDVQCNVRNKARVCFAGRGEIDVSAVQSAIILGERQEILDGNFISQPGVFGWDKIDKGSEVLARFLPDTLSGRGADFGCGYGFLSRHVLQHCRRVNEIICADADRRAVDLCAQNLDQYDVQKVFLWRDLTRTYPDVKNLDFIVMNPPFHEGKALNLDVGRQFIETAQQSLRKGGVLWMVANAHLSYEGALERGFQSVRKHFEGGGFKVFEAKV